MLENELEDAGLTKNETKVYIALIDIGQTTTNKIIKQTKINTSKVYESLQRLLNKGLVSYTIIKNSKHWIAENPERITEYLENEKKKISNKEERIKKIIPELEKRRSLKETTAEYKIFEGIKGIKTVRETALKELEPGETFYLILSNYPQEEKKLDAYFTEFHKKRAKKGIKCKYIFNQEMSSREKERKKIPLTEYKIIQTNAIAPTWTEFYNDKVSIGIMGANPSVMQIKNKEVVKGFKQYFDSLWVKKKSVRFDQVNKL